MPFFRNPETGKTYELRRDEVVFRKSLLLATIIILSPNIIASAPVVAYMLRSEVTPLRLLDAILALPFDDLNIFILRLATVEFILSLAGVIIAIILTNPKIDFPDDT